jgi:hypothetical protein
MRVLTARRVTRNDRLRSSRRSTTSVAVNRSSKIEGFISCELS